MTFDYAPNWMDTLSTTGRAGVTAKAAVMPSPLIPPPCAPATPSMAQVAILVEELFAEGTLTYDQLRSLSTVPELNALLGDALAGVSAERRCLRKPR